MDNKESGTGQVVRPEGFGMIYGVRGFLQGQTFPIGPNERFLVGRDPSQCDLILKGIHISGVHMEILYDPLKKLYTVTDKSKNGIILENKYKLQKDVPLEVAPGVSFLLGDRENEIILG